MLGLGYVKLVVVEVEVKDGYDDIFDVVLEVLEFFELLVDFGHLFEQEAGDIVLVLHLHGEMSTTLLKRGLRRVTPCSPSC